MFIIVDLPLPLGPMMARYSLRRMLNETPRRRVDRLAAHLVDLRDVQSISMTSGPGGRVMVQRVRRQVSAVMEHGWEPGERNKRFNSALSSMTLAPFFQ